jgi:hypothetical protein
VLHVTVQVLRPGRRVIQGMGPGNALQKPLDELHGAVQGEGIGRQMGTEVPDLADGRLEVLAELVGDAGQDDLHVVAFQVLLHVEVGAGMKVHQQLAGDQHPGLAAGAVIAEPPECLDGPPEGTDHLAQPLLGCGGNPLHTFAEPAAVS